MLAGAPNSHSLHMLNVEAVGDKFRATIKKERQRQGAIFTQQLRIVCGEGSRHAVAKCNNTWMGVIENNARPHLTNLIEGRECALKWPAQLAVASWIAVKAIVAEYTFLPNVSISEKERRFVWKNKRPPGHWNIWIGKYLGSAWKPANFMHRSFRADWVPPEMEAATPRSVISEAGGVTMNTQSTSIAIGELFIQVHSSALPTFQTSFGGIFTEKLQQLWPPPKDRFLKMFHQKIKWPPNHGGLIDDDVAFIANALFNDSMRIRDFPFVD